MPLLVGLRMAHSKTPEEYYSRASRAHSAYIVALCTVAALIIVLAAFLQHL